MTKPKVRKLAEGTYRVSFTKSQTFDVVIPNLWLDIYVDNEKALRKMAIECASEQLPAL